MCTVRNGQLIDATRRVLVERLAASTGLTLRTKSWLTWLGLLSMYRGGIKISVSLEVAVS